jgi:HSP20 family protein
MLTLNMLSEVDRLQEHINKLFEDTASRPLRNGPALNAWVNDEALKITAELPGINLDQLEISVHGDALSIRGTKREQTLKDGETWFRQERTKGPFARTFQLPFRVETEKVEAVYKNGILTLTLPRAEAEKPKKIAVKAA